MLPALSCRFVVARHQIGTEVSIVISVFSDDAKNKRGTFLPSAPMA
jgi:hypothetical protein